MNIQNEQHRYQVVVFVVVQMSFLKMSVVNQGRSFDLVFVMGVSRAVYDAHRRSMYP